MRHLTTPLTLLLAAAGTLAGDGRIPLYQATVITEPGSYLVTRDISASTTILTIQADGVDVDLNGFTLRVDDPGQDAITIARPGPVESGVRIHGGKIEGGYAGIFCFSAGEPARLRVHDMVISGIGEIGVRCTSADVVRVERVEVYDAASGLYLRGMASVRLVVRDNVVRDVDGSGMLLVAANGSVVSGNHISGFGSTVVPGLAAIEMEDGPAGAGRGNRIVDNVIENGVGGAHGIKFTDGVGTLVDGNVVDSADGYGIYMTGANYRLTNNVINGSTLSGIYAGGGSGYLERNSSQGNAQWGMTCGSSGLYYRANLLVPNTSGGLDSSPVCDFAADLGDNVR